LPDSPEVARPPHAAAVCRQFAGKGQTLWPGDLQRMILEMLKQIWQAVLGRLVTGGFMKLQRYEETLTDMKSALRLRPKQSARTPQRSLR